MKSLALPNVSYLKIIRCSFQSDTDDENTVGCFCVC